MFKAVADYSLKATSLKAMVVDRIRTAIIGGDYRPGTRLVEQTLAGEMGISRGPVREALLQLQQEGLVHITPRHGCVVTTLSPDQAAELYILRGHLESLAVRIAREHWTEADTAALQGMIEAMRRLGPGDWKEAIEADLRYHHWIVEASHHGSLIQMYSSMDAKIAACFMTVREHLQTQPSLMASRHQPLADVFRTGDFWRAEVLAAEHWAETAARFRQFQASKPAFSPSEDEA